MRKYALWVVATLATLVTPVFADLVSSYAVSGHNADGSSYDGKIKMPPAEQPSGARVGYLTDKFGINWVVTIDKA